ncbi:MAG: hypothetical protein ABIZ04_25205 [Opitutus sp.]
MKIRFALTPFVLSLLFATSQAATPPAAPPSPKQAPERELALVVITPVDQSGSLGANSNTDYDRLDLAFQEVAKRRHWPVKIVAERFASNTPDHELELRVYLQPIGQDLPQEFRFRSWMTLTEHGTKHDFGLIVHRQIWSGGESMDDFLEKLFRGAAAVAAKKIEPILFPQLVQPKP